MSVFDFFRKADIGGGLTEYRLIKGAMLVDVKPLRNNGPATFPPLITFLPKT